MSKNTNFSLRASEPDCVSHKTFKIVSGTLVFFIGCSINGSIIIALLRKPQLSVLNTLVFHLTIADFLVFLTNGPYLFISFIDHSLAFSPFLCQVAAFLGRFTTVVSMYLITVMSASRFYSLVKPFEYRVKVTTSKVSRVCFSAWLLSFLLALSPIIGWGKYSMISGQCWCALDPAKYTSNWFSHLTLAFLLPLVLNSWIFVKTLKLINRKGALKKRLQREKKGKEENGNPNRVEKDVDNPIPNEDTGATKQNNNEKIQDKTKVEVLDLEVTMKINKRGKDVVGAVNQGFESHGGRTFQSTSGENESMDHDSSVCSNIESRSYNNKNGNENGIQLFNKWNSKLKQKRGKKAAKKSELQEKKQEFKINFIVILLFLSYIIGCGPTYIVWSWFALYPKSVPRTAFVVFRFLAGVQSALNPLIYGIMNSEIRSEVWAFWKKANPLTYCKNLVDSI